jgi:hypothetical protein
MDSAKKFLLCALPMKPMVIVIHASEDMTSPTEFVLYLQLLPLLIEDARRGTELHALNALRIGSLTKLAAVLWCLTNAEPSTPQMETA